MTAGFPVYAKGREPAYHHIFLDCGDWQKVDLYGISSRELGRLGVRHNVSAKSFQGRLYDPDRIKGGVVLPKTVEMLLSETIAPNITNGLDFPYATSVYRSWKMELLKGSFFEKK